MRWRPFDKPLHELTEEDLQGLLGPEPVPEGLFVEYKREWKARPVARAVASFANSPGGGTLIVGVAAQKLMPISVPGIEEAAGELSEAAVNVIRTSVAPTPSFGVTEVELANGRRCLIVEVPEGFQPPYVLIRTGQILERTQTSSEPVPIQNRDTLDRLFLRGERGATWAREKALSAVEGMLSAGEVGSALWVIPAVDGGLSATRALYREPNDKTLFSIARSLYQGHAFSNDSIVTGSDFVTVTSSVWQMDLEVLVAATSLGILSTSCRRTDPMGRVPSIEYLAEKHAPLFAEFLEETLGYRGRVVVAACGRFDEKDTVRSTVSVVRRAEPLELLRSSDLPQAMKRHAARSYGYWVEEPPPGGA